MYVRMYVHNYLPTYLLSLLSENGMQIAWTSGFSLTLRVCNADIENDMTSCPQVRICNHFGPGRHGQNYHASCLDFNHSDFVFADNRAKAVQDPIGLRAALRIYVEDPCAQRRSKRGHPKR